MPEYPIDSDRSNMIATGKVAAQFEWDTEGRRTDRPKRDDGTGMPLWIVDVLVDDEDAARSVVAGVVVPSLDAPVVAKLHPITFERLRVSVYVQRRTGALVSSWSADGIKSQAAGRAGS